MAALETGTAISWPHGLGHLIIIEKKKKELESWIPDIKCFYPFSKQVVWSTAKTFYAQDRWKLETEDDYLIEYSV